MVSVGFSVLSSLSLSAFPGVAHRDHSWCLVPIPAGLSAMFGSEADVDVDTDSIDRYNPSNLSWMEEYLQSQVRDGEYDLFANLAILKLCVEGCFLPGVQDSLEEVMLEFVSLSIAADTSSTRN